MDIGFSAITMPFLVQFQYNFIYELRNSVATSRSPNAYCLVLARFGQLGSFGTKIGVGLVFSELAKNMAHGKIF